MTSLRTFFSLNLPSEVIKVLSLWRSQMIDLYPRFRWVNPYQMHLTLRFCGENPKDMVDRLAILAEESIKSLKIGEINLGFSGMGAFSPRSPRVLWLGIDGDIEKLNVLNEALEEVCRKAGLPADDKRFSPHLTLARIDQYDSSRLESDWFERLSSLKVNLPSWKTKEISLMKSDLSRYGPKYTTLKNYLI